MCSLMSNAMANQAPNTINEAINLDPSKDSTRSDQYQYVAGATVNVARTSRRPKKEQILLVSDVLVFAMVEKDRDPAWI